MAHEVRDAAHHVIVRRGCFGYEDSQNAQVMRRRRDSGVSRRACHSGICDVWGNGNAVHDIRHDTGIFTEETEKAGGLVR